jgi:phage terminase large subunit-like protein
MLSNTAVPKYYARFRDSVRRGEIPVCEKIALEMNRIDRLIADPRYYYDEAIVDGFVMFCENEMTLTDGQDLHLLDSFKLWAEEVFGWYYFERKTVFEPSPDGHDGKFVIKNVKHRLTNKQYLIVGPGAAKSLYDTCIHAYGMVLDKTTTYQCVVAPTMKQAEETVGPFKTALARAKGPVFKFLTEGSIQNTTGNKLNRVKLTSTKKGIENFLTNSLMEIRPMAIDKLQGMRPKYSTVDEWLSCDIREDVVGAIEQGASKLDDYLIVCTSSEGTARSGVGDTIKMELESILKGDYIADHVSIWWYCLDDIKEVADQNLWIKANPNIAVLNKYEEYARDVERAEHAPDTRNDILAKRFGLPMEGFTYFFTYQETLTHPRRDFWNMPCAIGCDLSQGDDFCAFTFLFPIHGGGFGIKTRCYITSRTLMHLPGATRQMYQHFIEEGSLMVLEGSVLEMMEVYDDLDKYIIDSAYDVRCLGFDPYNAREFVERWERENGPFGIEKVIQGAKTESVPLGELKTLAADRMLIFDQEMMKYTMGNCIVVLDNNNNRKLSKMRRQDKIDSVAAMMDAYIAYKANKDQFE